MKILILGSSGQIGKPTTKFLRDNNYEVIEWDIIKDQSNDLRIPNKQLYNAINKSDFVYYLASDVGGAKYLEKNQDSFNFIHNNMLIMCNTFKTLKECNKPFIFTSSQMADLNHSTYGQLKLLGEKITNNIGGLVVRLWNVYAEETDPEKSHVITDFIKMAKTFNKINMRTDGMESRQFLHAEDCAKCLLTLTKKYKELDRTKQYHITSFEWTTIKDIALIISNLTGCELVYSKNKDKTQMNAMNPPNNYILNFWKPTISLREGIKSLINLKNYEQQI
jgi:nucleoside-diphosphate-sugar epimerase